MALIKSKIVKGIPCNYWKLLNIASDLIRNSTTFTLAVYYSHEARLESIENTQDYVTVVSEGVGFTVEEAYKIIKKSRKGMDIIDGVSVEVEKNWFADAEDVIEIPEPKLTVSPTLKKGKRKAGVRKAVSIK